MTVRDFVESLVSEVGGVTAREETPGAPHLTTAIRAHMDVISRDDKVVGTVDHLEGPDRIKLTRSGAPDGHHHFIPFSWIHHVDEQVHLDKEAAEVTAHWAG
jgi:hypothetical protein